MRESRKGRELEGKKGVKMFTIPVDSTLINMDFELSPLLVMLSILMGGIGAFTAFTCDARAGRNALISNVFWVGLASIAMALGIWVMHFIGMAAMRMPVAMSHDMWLTAISILPALIASFIAFYVINLPRKGPILYFVASIIMGFGMTGMHLIGVYAMKLDGVQYFYSPVLFSVSLLASIMGSFAALYLFSSLQHLMMSFFVRLAASVILGTAIAVMHYGNIYAMKFYISVERVAQHGVMNAMEMTFLASGVAISIIVILLLFLMTTLLDYYIEQRISFFDPLTRVPNRRMFQKRLESSAKGHAVALLYFHDLESYNHEFGYLFTDRLIRYISSILAEYRPAMTDIYRTEGNIFTYVANDRTAMYELQQEIDALSAYLKEGIVFEEKEILLQGVCSFSASRERSSLKDLYLNGRLVLKHPSTDYRMDVIEYNAEIHTQSFTEELLRDLEQAMRNNDLFLLYQPKMDVEKNAVTGVEALIRWQHPKHGFLSPAVFLPVLEEYNRMDDVTDWIIEQVCSQLDEWRQEIGMPSQVAINIPGPYLTSPRLRDRLSAMRNKYSIAPEAIELEITETSFVKTIASAEKAVQEFRREGFSVALDDFGTGVSSLSYLRKIPINTLKIDKSFIDAVPASGKDASIIKAIIQLGESLNMTIVVEGVETSEQVNFLTEHCGAPQIQGFFFAKPMKAAELSAWCKKHFMLTEV